MSSGAPQPSHPDLTAALMDPNHPMNLNRRVTELEERWSGTGGSEPSIKEQLDEMRRDNEAQARLLKQVVDAVGESPDAATGKEGTGMRKQLAVLVDSARKPTLVQWATALGTAALAVYQVLKGLGILK